MSTAREEKMKSYYPLCRLLQEATKKPLADIAKEAGIKPQQLWQVCKHGYVGKKTLLQLWKAGVPINVLESYVEMAFKLKAERVKRELREELNRLGR